MESLIILVEDLKKHPINKTINQRMQEFEELGKQSSNEIFKELCFCFLTANFNAEGGIKIQKNISDGFLYLQEHELAKKLAELKHRFPNARAGFIFAARSHKDSIKEALSSIGSQQEMREWLVNNFKGIGMKESSHFLRNIGYNDVAILDFHIIDILVDHGVIERPKTLTPKKYIEIENILRELAKATNTSLGKLDLYLWYKETGKVLK